jgi:hypothetical protein
MRENKVLYMPVPEPAPFLPISAQPIAAVGVADRRQHILAAALPHNMAVNADASERRQREDTNGRIHGSTLALPGGGSGAVGTVGTVPLEQHLGSLMNGTYDAPPEVPPIERDDSYQPSVPQLSRTISAHNPPTKQRPSKETVKPSNQVLHCLQLDLTVDLQ